MYNIRLRKPSKAMQVMLLCSMANLINAADRVIMPLAIVPLHQEYEWSLQWQGWILSAFAFGYMPSQIIGGNAAVRFGGKRTLLFSVLIWSLSTFITPFVVSSIPILIVTRVLLGLGEGIGLPTVFHIFAHHIPPELRSRAFAYLVAGGSVGQVVASVLCPAFHWSVGFFFFGILGFLWVILWIICFAESNSLGTAEDQLPIITPKVTKLDVPWIEFISHWPLWAIYIAHFSMNWSNYIIMQWLPTYLSRTLGADMKSMSFTAFPYIANSIFAIGAGHLADWLATERRWSLLAVRRLMTLLGLMGPGIFLLAFSQVSSLALAVILVSISMGLVAFNSAGHLSNHSEVAPNHAGLTFAVSNTLATIPGLLCGPLTAGLVTASHGRWFPVFALAAGINLTGAMIYSSQSSATQVL